MALVIYDESIIEDAVKLPSRVFTFCSRDVYIEQGYGEGGKGGTTIGFGASVYDASIVLSRYMEEHSVVVRNKTVLELGSGPGLNSIVANLCGAKQVICTDGDDISVALSTKNIAASPTRADTIQAQRLFWGNNEDMDKTLKAVQGGCYDVVIASDVIVHHYSAAYEALISTLQKLCAINPALVILMTWQERYIPAENEFMALFREQFVLTEIDKKSFHADFQKKFIGKIRMVAALLRK